MSMCGFKKLHPEADLYTVNQILFLLNSHFFNILLRVKLRWFIVNIYIYLFYIQKYMFYA